MTLEWKNTSGNNQTKTIHKETKLHHRAYVPDTTYIRVYIMSCIVRVGTEPEGDAYYQEKKNETNRKEKTRNYETNNLCVVNVAVSLTNAAYGDVD